MEIGSTAYTWRKSRFSSCERLVAIGLVIMAVASPLFIDRRPAIEDAEEDGAINFSVWLPLLFLILIFALFMSLFLDKSFTRFDPYWIHRVGGSSGGIILLLIFLSLILKLKA